MPLIAEIFWRKEGGIAESFGTTSVNILVYAKSSKFPVFCRKNNLCTGILNVTFSACF